VAANVQFLMAVSEQLRGRVCAVSRGRCQGEARDSEAGVAGVSCKMTHGADRRELGLDKSLEGAGQVFEPDPISQVLAGWRTASEDKSLVRGPSEA